MDMGGHDSFRRTISIYGAISGYDLTSHTEGIITIAAEREIKQSKSEEQLWKWLKNRSKTT